MKVDFYILEYGNRDTKALFACEVLEKAYNTNQSVHVLMPSKTEAIKFDQLLWTYREDSFVPHDIENETSPITIGFDATLIKREVLINLTNDFHIFNNQIKHIIEIVPNDPTLQSAARDRYRKYRDSGSELTTHKIKR